jgi:hypothetical protein
VAGCAPSGGSSNEADDFQGAEKEVAEVLDDLSTAARQGDEKEICSTLLARNLVRQLDRSRGRCVGAVEDQLEALNDADIDIRAVTVTGTTATARLVSQFNGDDRESTVRLTRDAGRWRVSGSS